MSANRKHRALTLRSVCDELLGTVFILREGSILYTGGKLPEDELPHNFFLTPHRQLAQMYATLKGGTVHRFRTKRPLRLVPKNKVVWALRKGAVAKGEWNGFGSSEGDAPVAAALRRRAGSATSWLFGIDGWVHSYASKTLGEVMVADPSACLERAPPR